MALAKDKNRLAAGVPGPTQPLPVAAGAVIYKGALVCISASGYAVPADDDSALKVAGVAITGLDNTDGANGVLGASPARYVQVQPGLWPFAVAGSPVAGATVYVTDDDALSTVAADLKAGVCWEPNPDVTGEWFVFIAGLHPGLSVAAAADPGDLTEDAGAIGGTNDGDIPDLTATAATVTGTLTGTVDGALADVAAIALSTSNTYSDDAVNTAVNTAITATNLQLKELQTALNEVIADNVVLRAAIREIADAHNDLLGALRTAGVIA